jgi:hypothetical protein
VGHPPAGGWLTFYIEDWTNNTAATTDRMLMRYAEILLVLAEAKFELNGSISDADLDLTVNALRTRAGLPVKLTNAFVTANNTAPGNRKFEIRLLDNITDEFEVDIFSTAFRRPVTIN